VVKDGKFHLGSKVPNDAAEHQIKLINLAQKGDARPGLVFLSWPTPSRSFQRYSLQH
jgi:hypothetical protein